MFNYSVLNFLKSCKFLLINFIILINRWFYIFNINKLIFALNDLKRYKSLRTAIITTIIKKKHFEKKRENLLIMQFTIHSNRRNVMNVIGAMLISSQSAFDAFSKNFAQIKAKLNTKINKIKRLYESKEKNLSKMMLWMIMTRFLNMMKNATRHECANKTKKANDYFEKQITRLKKMIKKLKKVIEKTKNTIEKSI